jgi:hypothetical protein
MYPTQPAVLVKTFESTIFPLILKSHSLISPFLLTIK